jgi:hypothetical protein
MFLKGRQSLPGLPYYLRFIVVCNTIGSQKFWKCLERVAIQKSLRTPGLWVRLGKVRFFWYQKIFLKNIFCRLFRKYCAYLRKVFWNICCRFLLIVTFFILVNRDLSSLTFLAWCEVWSNNQLTWSW